MKIIHVIWSLGGGGKERRLIQLIKGLDSRGIKQSLVTFSDKCDYSGDFEQHCNFLVIKGENKINRCINFSRFIKEERPDVVHLWQGLPFISLYLPLIKKFYRFKYVAGFIADAIPVNWLSFKTISNQFTYYFADAIVSNSKAGLIAKRADYKKAKVIYNGFDFNRFCGLESPKLTFRDSIGVTKKYVATMVARFTSSKDYHMFVELASMMQTNQDIVFLAVGKGPDLDYYINYCKDKCINNILFLGFRTDVEEILMNSDFGLLFTNPTVHAEGVSNSILESMAAGLPVIATRGGGTGEIIEDRESGFIIEPGDIASAADLLNKMMNDHNLQIRIGHNAKQRVYDHFTLDSMTEAYINLYKSLYD